MCYSHIVTTYYWMLGEQENYFEMSTYGVTWNLNKKLQLQTEIVFISFEIVIHKSIV